MRNLISDEFLVLDAIENERASNARLAYIREITQDEASAFVDLNSESGLPAAAKLYAVRTGDGKMIGITDSWAAAYWTALSNDCSPLSVH